MKFVVPVIVEVYATELRSVFAADGKDAIGRRCFAMMESNETGEASFHPMSVENALPVLCVSGGSEPPTERSVWPQFAAKSTRVRLFDAAADWVRFFR